MKVNNSIFHIDTVNSVIMYDTIDSTNEEAKRLSRIGRDNCTVGGVVDGTLIVANMQTAGKGRLGRHFLSPSQDGIYFSLLLKPSLETKHISQITIVAAMATAKAIKDLDVNVLIKWPNDIVYDGKKVVGILTEMRNDNVIVGIGINVNNDSFPEEIRKYATSIKLISNKEHKREPIVERVMFYFDKYYKMLLQTKDLSLLVSEYNSLLANKNQEIFIIPQTITSAIRNTSDIKLPDNEAYMCEGIDESGALICKNKLGEIKTINSGEVSIRTKKGYC